MLGRLRRRRSEHVTGEPAVAPLSLDLQRYEGIDALLDAGDIPGALDLLQRTDGTVAPAERARQELQLRHEAFLRAGRLPHSTVPWPPRSDRDLGPAGRLPEVRAADLDPPTLVAGVRTYGALIVRGFFPQSACERMRVMIDQSMSLFDHERLGDDPEYNMPLRDVHGDILGASAFRSFNYGAAGLPVADAPVLAECVLGEFAAIDLPRLVGGYLGERPSLTLEKWMMRKVPPETGSSWHQDGAFLGTDKRALNMWVALSDCGERASGLDIVARRFDHIVATGTPGAYFDWDVSPTVVEEERGADPIVSPVFAAGDAVFFDQFLLHKTGTNPGFTEYRYALESWFFTPTSFPEHYAGLLL